MDRTFLNIHGTIVVELVLSINKSDICIDSYIITELVDHIINIEERSRLSLLNREEYYLWAVSCLSSLAIVANHLVRDNLISSSKLLKLWNVESHHELSTLLSRNEVSELSCTCVSLIVKYESCAIDAFLRVSVEVINEVLSDNRNDDVLTLSYNVYDLKVSSLTTSLNTLNNEVENLWSLSDRLSYLHSILSLNEILEI